MAKLAVTPNAGLGDALTAEVEAKGPAGSTAIKLAIPAVTRRGPQIAAERGTVELELERGEHTLRSLFSTAPQLNWRTRSVELRAVEASFTVVGPRLPRKGVSGELKGNAHVDTAHEGVDVNLTGYVNESQIVARVRASGFASPVYTFALEVDQLDVDRYIATTAGTRQARKGTAADHLLGPLADFPATGSVKIGVLKTADAKATNVRLELK